MSAKEEDLTSLPERLSYLKSKKIGELKEILSSRNVPLTGLLEKDDFIDKIVATDHLRPAPQPSPKHDLKSPRVGSQSAQLGGLQVRVMDNQSRHFPDPLEAPSLGFLLLHGYGANKDDLAPFARSVLEKVEPSLPVFFYLAEAPLSLGSSSSFAWWPLDLGQMLFTLQTKGFDGLFDREPPPGMPEAVEKCLALLDVIRSRHTLLAVGGFSQGSMLSVELALETLFRPSEGRRAPLCFLACMSGANCCPKAWAELASHVSIEKPVRVIQSHGKSDPIVPYPLGLKLAAFLKSCSFFDHQFIDFAGQHGIPPSIQPLLVESISQCF